MSVNSITSSRFGYNCSPRGGAEVDPALVRELENRGFPRPIRTLNDPRLRLPELLLMNGWERSETRDAVTYTMACEADPSARQSVLFGSDARREVVTEVGDRRHVLRALPDGTVEEIRG